MRRLGFHPEKVLTLEQIQKLQKLSLEDVAGYVSREVAASRVVREEAFPHIKSTYKSSNPECNFFCRKIVFDLIDLLRICPYSSF